jgi:hypothetical protein
MVALSSATSTIGGPDGVVVVVVFVSAVDGGVDGDDESDPDSGVVEVPDPLGWPDKLFDLFDAKYDCC